MIEVGAAQRARADGRARVSRALGFPRAPRKTQRVWGGRTTQATTAVHGALTRRARWSPSRPRPHSSIYLRRREQQPRRGGPAVRPSGPNATPTHTAGSARWRPPAAAPRPKVRARDALRPRRARATRIAPRGIRIHTRVAHARSPGRRRTHNAAVRERLLPPTTTRQGLRLLPTRRQKRPTAVLPADPAGRPIPTRRVQPVRTPTTPTAPVAHTRVPAPHPERGKLPRAIATNVAEVRRKPSERFIKFTAASSRGDARGPALPSPTSTTATTAAAAAAAEALAATLAVQDGAVQVV